MKVESEEILKLKNDLLKAKEIIENQNNKIKQLESQLSESKKKNGKYENELKSKSQEIDELKDKLNKLTLEKKPISRNQIMCVFFTSIDQKINRAIPCIDSDLFAQVEENLYKEYPEYRETNNTFLANGKQILRFKTIRDNKIGNGVPIILYTPGFD